jgi:hypothetical protein
VNFGVPAVSFLWHNVIGAVTVVIVGMIISVATRTGGESGRPTGAAPVT